MYDNNSFEKVPGSPETNAERELPPEQDFAKSFSEGVPEFAGEQFGVAHQGNEYYGEATDEEETDSDEYNEGVADAASIINYGLDAVAREKGVESVVQGIKSFDVSGSDNPLRDLYEYLGLNTKEEFEDVRDESIATKSLKAQFRDTYNMPKANRKSREGAMKAIADMKELISEVEGADPRYAELRDNASAAGKGYFEYAVKDYGLRGLTELFSVLAEQKARKEQEEQAEQIEQEEQEEPSEPVEQSQPDTTMQ